MKYFNRRLFNFCSVGIIAPPSRASWGLANFSLSINYRRSSGPLQNHCLFWQSYLRYFFLFFDFESLLDFLKVPSIYSRVPLLKLLDVLHFGYVNSRLDQLVSLHPISRLSVLQPLTQVLRSAFLRWTSSVGQGSSCFPGTRLSRGWCPSSISACASCTFFWWCIVWISLGFFGTSCTSHGTWRRGCSEHALSQGSVAQSLSLVLYVSWRCSHEDGTSGGRRIGSCVLSNSRALSVARAFSAFSPRFWFSHAHAVQVQASLSCDAGCSMQHSWVPQGRILAVFGPSSGDPSLPGKFHEWPRISSRLFWNSSGSWCAQSRPWLSLGLPSSPLRPDTFYQWFASLSTGYWTWASWASNLLCRAWNDGLLRSLTSLWDSWRPSASTTFWPGEKVWLGSY